MHQTDQERYQRNKGYDRTGNRCSPKQTMLTFLTNAGQLVQQTQMCGRQQVIYDSSKPVGFHLIYSSHI